MCLCSINDHIIKSAYRPKIEFLSNCHCKIIDYSVDVRSKNFCTKNFKHLKTIDITIETFEFLADFAFVVAFDSPLFYPLCLSFALLTKNVYGCTTTKLCSSIYVIQENLWNPHSSCYDHHHFQFYYAHFFDL